MTVSMSATHLDSHRYCFCFFYSSNSSRFQQWEADSAQEDGICPDLNPYHLALHSYCCTRIKRFLRVMRQNLGVINFGAK